MKKFLLIAIALLLSAVNIIQAQYILRAPTVRYNRPSERGNIVYVANSIINTGGAGQNTAPPEAAGSGNNNNGFTTNYIDIDGDATTYSSSSANLNLASCTEVLFAGLYWGAGRGGVGGAAPANSTNDTAWITAAPNTANTVRFRLPGGAYTNITASVFDRFNQARVRVGVPAATVSHSGYMCFADVTTMVRGLANPNGTYFLANMVGPIAAGKQAGYGGWTMVIVYADPLLQVRNLTVFDGCVVVSPSAGNVDVNVAGFITPPSGPVSCQLGAVVIDGDRNDGNDAYQFSQTGAVGPFRDLTPTRPVPGNATSRLNDTWNSTISYNGAVVATRNPAFNNTYGYDADIFEIPNTNNDTLGNNRTSATVRFNTTAETYHLQVITTSISNFNPTYSFEKTATDINGGAFLPGDSILYKIRYSNRGNDSSTNTIITDNLPSGTAYIPGSIRIGVTSRTDASGDDQAEYDFTNNRINFRLGVGANSVTGGRVAAGVVDSVEFKVVSPSSCTIVGCVGSLRNSARINYGGKLSGGVFYDSSGIRNAGCLVLGPVIMPLSGVCSNPRDTILVNRCTSATVLLPYGRYAGYTFYSAMPFIPANIYNQYVPVTATGIYWAYFSNGFGCSDTARIVVIITNCPDIDDDNDGIPDYVEFDSTLALLGAPQNWNNPAYGGYVDNNLDLVNDNFDWGADADNDRIPNFYDTNFWRTFVDVNNDGVNDKADKDLDGIPNQYDLDSDNDGIPDTVESYGVDTNGNGLIDNYADPDNDGFSNNVDASGGGVNGSGNGLGPQDLDRDSIPNYLDLDSDNDGIPDLIEALGPDTDNDGKIDAFADANSDGIADNYILASAILITGVDVAPFVPDGRADNWPNKNLDRDFRPNAYDMDSDGDGIADVIEAGLPDANLNGIVDGVIFGGLGNGWSPTVSAMPALNLRNTDGIGNFDFLDIDSDQDGIPDNIEGQTTVGYATPTLTDADGDGLMLPYDNTPLVFGGSGILVYDHDGDATPDYRDLDTDADGLIDRVEGNDYNLNGSPDDLVTPTGLDTDGDGLDNRYDSLNSVTNIKGTSYRMGNGGSFTGDAAPGSRTTVQRTIVTQPDRDWRYSGYVLPVRFLNLTGLLQTDKVLLNWSVIADKAVDRFEVERSTDNSNFINTGIVTQPVKLNEEQGFSFTDDVTSVNKEVIYYRIKVIGKAGEIQYSNILVIRRQQTQTQFSIMPNPAQDYVSISFFAEKESEITIRLIDNTGKMVIRQTQKVSRGSNTLQLAGLSKYSNGVYALQFFVNDEVITQKLILLK